MNKTFKKILSAALALVMVVSVAFVAAPEKAQAAETIAAREAFAVASDNGVNDITKATDTPFESGYYAIYMPREKGKKGYTLIYPKYGWSGKKITSLKSSNKAFKVKKSGNNIRIDFKCNVSNTKITGKIGGQKFSFKLNIYKWTNPVSSFKYAGKEYKSNYTDKAYFFGSVKGSKKKLEVKAAKGWKIYRVSGYQNGKYSSYDYNLASKVSLKWTFKKNSDFVFVYLYNPSKGIKADVELAPKGH